MVRDHATDDPPVQIDWSTKMSFAIHGPSHLRVQPLENGSPVPTIRL